MPAAKKKATKRVDPFKVKKSGTSSSKSLEALVPPENIKVLIDEYREAADNAKKYDGEKKALAAQIKPWALEKAAERRMKGINSNFNICGEHTTCQFQMQEKVSGIDEDYLASFTDQYSEKVADAVFKKDFGSIRLDGKYLEEHYDEIIEKLMGALGDHMQHLFKPATFGLTEDGLEKAKKFAKSPEELAELFSAMKVTSFIK